MRLTSLILAAAILVAPACAQMPDSFTGGPIVQDYGKVADVPGLPALPEGTVMKVAFDVANAGETGKPNRNFDSVARFLNMHGRAGVDPGNLHVAIVVHGGASADLLRAEDNPNAPLIAALIENGVTIQLCGQTAMYRGIKQGDLLPGVDLALSAMTAHALLQQDGYTLNPF